MNQCWLQQMSINSRTTAILWEYHSDVISKPVTIEKQSERVAKRHIGESLRGFRRGGIKPGHL